MEEAVQVIVLEDDMQACLSGIIDGAINEQINLDKNAISDERLVSSEAGIEDTGHVSSTVDSFRLNATDEVMSDATVTASITPKVEAAPLTNSNVKDSPVMKSLLDKKDLKDEPISESEFQLLYVDLENPKNHPVPYMQINTTTVKRGRGRPKGTKNRPSLEKSKKKGVKPKPKRFETELIPDRLKKKAKVESDLVIDLSKRTTAPVSEKSFDLKDRIDKRTWKRLEKRNTNCTFCNKPGNFAVLGSLFGPYKLIVDHDSTSRQDIRSQKGDRLFGVRLHRDCAIWTPCLCLVESELNGLGSAISDAARKKCDICTDIGATLVCSNKSCSKAFHFVCAKQIGCLFNKEDFTIRCVNHK